MTCCKSAQSRHGVGHLRSPCGLFIIVLPRAGAPLNRIGRALLNPLILIVDDEPDVEMLFRQQFRHDLRASRLKMEFAQSGDIALQRIADAANVSLILILSDVNMPGMTGLELLPRLRCFNPTYR